MALALAHPLPATVAAVDLGSNSFHMIVARADANEIVVLDRLREMVQLAAGLDEERNLAPAARARALECLRRFGERLRHMPEHAVRAVGTNTLRSARNAAEFLAEAETALGHPIETISGMEEARLIYLGVSHTLAEPAARRLVVDIGGGSTEIVFGKEFQPLLMDSLYLGCVTVSRTHFAGGKIDAARWERARLAALQEFEPIRARYRDLGWEYAVGASGTVRAIHNVVRAAGWSKDAITPRSLEPLRAALLQAGRAERVRLEGLSAQRRSVFPGGVVLLAAAFESLGIERMQPSEGALREGLLYDLLGRFRQEDVRNRSVSALGDRYHVDWKQAGRVECTALELFALASEAWGLGPGERQLLSWAAQLHEIGLDIAHQHYHRHGGYVIEQSDLHGFSRDEQRRLAALVRAHRRKLSTAELRAAAGRKGRHLERLAVVLRLAVMLHRSRSPDALPGPRLRVAKRAVELRFPEGWLDAHPLTRADLEQERGYLRAAKIKLEFS